MKFKNWLESRMGAGGSGSGLEPIKQNPTEMPGAWSDYHSKESNDDKNKNGQLPPIKKKLKK